MNEAERHRLPGAISRQLQTCLRLFRPKDARLAKGYDHVVESDICGSVGWVITRGHPANDLERHDLRPSLPGPRMAPTGRIVPHRR